MTDRRWWQLVSVMTMAMIAVGSLVPPPPDAAPIGSPIPVSIVLHLLAYGALSVTLMGAQRSHQRAVIVAVGVATGFGVGMEIAQLQVSGREGTLTDALTNAIGAAMGACGWHAFR
jgi:VanZ family protein